MALNFPRQQDVRLLRSPLTEVVWQVRFPPILRIASEDPSEFQEQVRRRFPRYEEEQGFLFQFGLSGAERVPSPAPAAAQLTPRLYRFRTVDEQTVITLAADFYAVSTTAYTIWEEFSRDLMMAHEAVQQTYQPAFATRIGLRYVDHIVPSKLSLSTFTEVVELLRPELTALLKVDVWTSPAEMLCQLLLEDDEGALGLRFGVRTTGDEPIFVLDFDYYDDRELPFESIVDRCHRYHEIIYDAFLWCIKADKLDVFQPVAKEA